jgi:prepilin-type N-terminal cleavage/methylation domain-containing protein
MHLKNQAGLTLIEVAIVIAVIGILLIPTLSVYGIYRTDQIKRESDDRLNTIENALQRYAIRTGRYPIPAHRNIGPDEAEFGREALLAGMEDCTPNMGTACRIPTPDTVYRRPPSWNVDLTCTAIDPGCEALDDSFGSLLVGDIPIAELGMPVNFIADGYGGKFTYAVTEAQTDATNFETGAGGSYNPSHFEDAGFVRMIRVDGSDVSGTNGDLHFAVLSHGEDQRGTFSLAGNLIRECGSINDGRGFINCNLDDRVFTDNTGEIGVAPNIITTSYHVKRPGDEYFDDYVGYANSVTSEIWTRVISTAAEADIFSRSVGNIRLGANAALDNPPHPMAKVEVHGNMRMDQVGATLPRLLAGRLCAPQVDAPGDQPLLTSHPRFSEFDYDLVNDRSERFVVAHTDTQVYWPLRNSDGTLVRPIVIDPARPIFVDDECPLPEEVTGLTQPWPGGVFTSEVIAGVASEADAGLVGGGILCPGGDGLKGWQNVDEECEEILYNGDQLTTPCVQTSGEYSSGVINGEFTCHTN